MLPPLAKLKQPPSYDVGPNTIEQATSRVSGVDSDLNTSEGFSRAVKQAHESKLIYRERMVTTRGVGLWQKGGKDRAGMDTPHPQVSFLFCLWAGKLDY